jgi:hypothetical protein
VPHSASPFVIRQAEAVDKGQVLTFCEHTFGWDDIYELDLKGAAF